MTDFHTVKISDPGIEATDLRFITVKSKALKRRADVTVFLPPHLSESDASGKLPLVILLHGVYGSHWDWSFKGRAHLTALDMIEQGEIGPTVIAMPSDSLWGDGSGYLELTFGNVEDWVVNEVPHCCLHLPELSQGFTSLYIAGLSMGGYGALRLGAKFCQRFSGISGHSSATDFKALDDFVEDPLDPHRINSLEDADVFYWMYEHRSDLPPLRFDCGIDDPLIDGNRKLHAKLEEAGIEHQYQEFPGAHEWPYWTEHLRETLLFFDRIEKSK